MRKVSLIILIASTVLLLPACNTEKFPAKSITDVIVFSAGGGTDTCNRIVGDLMAKELGVPFTYENTPGDNGGVGMKAVYDKPHDGYTIAGISESTCSTAVLGKDWKQKMDTWDVFIIGGSPDIISVTKGAPYKDLKELIDAARKNPKTIKAGASAIGSLHYINLIALEKGSGAQFVFIPQNGSGPTHTAAEKGEISVVITSVAEQKAMIQAGTLIPLATLIPEDFNMPGVGMIKSAFSSYPGLVSYLPVTQAISMAIAADTPVTNKQTLEKAFKKAMESETLKTWAAENLYTLSGKTGEAAKVEYAHLESLFSWILWDLDKTKAVIDPAALGIKRS